jgi:hypothetical protein
MQPIQAYIAHPKVPPHKSVVRGGPPLRLTIATLLAIRSGELDFSRVSVDESSVFRVVF